MRYFEWFLKIRWKNLSLIKNLTSIMGLIFLDFCYNQVGSQHLKLNVGYVLLVVGAKEPPETGRVF